ncbi:MAG TPA: S41 family peptidase [Planctomycetota bacterium]
MHHRSTSCNTSRHWVNVLLLLSILAFSIKPAPAAAAEKLTPERVSELIPQLFKLHLSQHEMDAPFVKRLLKQLVEQLDPDKIFYLKDEAEAVWNLPEKDLKALAEQTLNGDFSHYRKIIDEFLTKRVPGSDAMFTALEKKADQIKAEGNAEAKEDKPADDQFKWSQRPATKEERDARLYKSAVEMYRIDKSYLTEEESLKQSLQILREIQNKWKKIAANDEETAKLFLKGFMLAMDPHTEYMDADDEEEFNERLERSFTGIGVQIRPCPLGAQVDEVIKGGPSDRSGKLSRGDQIVAVDSSSLAGLPINKIVKRIKGPKGTQVKLTILKHDDHKTEVLTLVRDSIQLADIRVKGKRMDTAHGAVGLISVQAFYAGVHNDVRERIKELTKDGPLAAVVLDLRSNAGGYLEEAVGLAGLFIDSGPIVGERDGAERIHWNYDPDHDVAYAGPLIVMVNQFSASASEIVAGALKDYGRALIVGATQTYGKGTVQRVIPLSSTYLNLPGDIKITTHQYFLAGGESVQLKGVEPDVVIPGPKLLEEDGMLERITENAVPWSKIKGKLDRNRPEIKRWLEWKQQEVAELQNKSNARVAGNPELKELSEHKTSRKTLEAGKSPEKRSPANSPGAPNDIDKDKEKEKDLQADEAVAIASDMVPTWPPAARQAAK